MNDAIDPRPRPQYGEYATAEEQQARIKQPDISQALDTGVVADVPQGQLSPDVIPAETPVVGEGGAKRQNRRRPFDRAATFGLLVYGLITVVTSFTELVEYNPYAEQMLSMMGVDTDLAATIAGQSWGIAAALVLVFGWFVTAMFSWMSMSRGRISWWIPLVGAFVFTSISALLMLVPLMNTPGVWQAILDAVA
ncbi:DUF6264 family protein [Microbacterium sp. NPDC076911]|uniref:DUF6264 family protein n=1 Tax=Microbacterium sp. NPDC076911 TaxID=3154958 RepID=UPI0034425F3D